MLTCCLCDTAHDQPVLLLRSVIALYGLIEAGEHIKLLRRESPAVEKERKRKNNQKLTNHSVRIVLQQSATGVLRSIRPSVTTHVSAYGPPA